MKWCPKCEIERPLAEFLPPSGKGVVRSYCRPCWAQYSREYNKRRPDVRRATERKYRQNNRDVVNSQAYEWRNANREQWNAIQTKWRKEHLNPYMKKKRSKNRDLVFAHYGSKCACCGETETMFLSVDHINNDGAAHRKSLKGGIGKGGSSFYDWMVREDFPEGFQILCRNCNWGKFVNGGICPHQDR